MVDYAEWKLATSKCWTYKLYKRFLYEFIVPLLAGEMLGFDVTKPYKVVYTDGHFYVRQDEQYVKWEERRFGRG